MKLDLFCAVKRPNVSVSVVVKHVDVNGIKAPSRSLLRKTGVY